MMIDSAKLFERRLNLPDLLARKSFFLFGPRATGKSTLIQQQFPDARIYDLLNANTYRDLLKNPALILEQTQNAAQIIAIDEIQKLPSLLDEVHRLISKHNLRFLLTGSSARKLKRGAANLLAGRAWWAELFSLSWVEIPDFDLLTYLNTGGLPQIYANPDYKEELRSYVSLYLKEEVQAEALTRNMVAFSEFLDAIALSNGSEISYESLARDCAVSPGTLKNYISILEDTHLGFLVPGYSKTKKRKGITRAKHYLFDLGVTNTLTHRGRIHANSELFGNAFEHFIACELRAYLNYSRSEHGLRYWRSTSQFEVDFVIAEELGVAVKATKSVSTKHLKGLRALKEEKIFRHYLVVSLDPQKRTTSDGIEILPWTIFLQELWQGRWLNS